MVTPISESAARAVLLQKKSEASNPEYFKATRCENGWLFRWRSDRGAVPMGTHSWVVADNGNMRMLGYQDSCDDAIAEELAKA